jgi:DNA-binding transcriptional regulator YdaS (Cro superfamily)
MMRAKIPVTDEMAAALGVNKSTISRWNTGTTGCPAERLADVVAATGISRENLRPDIFGDAKTAQPSQPLSEANAA